MICSGMPTQAMQGSQTPLDLSDLTGDLNPMSLVKSICTMYMFDYLYMFDDMILLISNCYNILRC